MSSRSNKKRKPRKDHTNRERTVTTLTGAPNTEYLVPIPSEEPPIFNPNAKMQGTMAPPYPVQHSPSFQYHSGRPPGANTSGYASFDTMNTMQHVQSQQSSVYGPTGTQHHQQPGGQATTTSGRSQEAKPTPRLPPGKNDLEILENLKRIIKEGQHPFFRAVPQPAALASLYKGVIPVSDSKDGDATEKTSTTAAPKDSEPVHSTTSTAAENEVSVGSGAKLGSKDRDRYSPGSQLLGELSLSANGTNGPGAPPTSAGSTHDSHRDNGPPPPSSAFSSASTNLPDEPRPHDEPYDPTRSREYYSAPNRPPQPDSVYERPPAGYPNKDYNGYDTKEPLPPRRAAWGGPPPPRDFNNRSDHDQGYDSRPVSDSRATISFGPPPSFPHGVEFGGDGIPSQQRRPNDDPRRRNRRDQHLELVDPIIERSLHIPDLAPGQTDPAELRPLIEKAREEKRKNQLGQGDAAGAQGAGAAMTATESRPLPTGTMPTEGASTLRESEIPSAQRVAEAAAGGDDHDNDIRSSRASSGGTPRVTTFVIPASPPIIPIAGIDVPIPEKKLPSDALDQDQSAANDNEDQPIKIERPPYGRQFYGSLPPGETALDIGALAPLFHEIQRQEEIRKSASAAAESVATPYAASTSSSTGRGGPPQEYPPAPESRRHTPQDNLPLDSGPPPAHPPARFERERYPRDIRDARDSRDSRDASPASHAPRRYPPPSPPGSVRGGPHPPHDAPDRDRDRDWQYHQQHNYGRRERWGDHWDPSESYGRDYPPPPPRSGGWDLRDREYPPRDYPPGPPHLDDRDRPYAPPPPIDDRRDRPPPGPYNPPYGRVRHRSPSPPPPPRRPGGGPPDDLRPPTKRARDDYGDYYTPAPPPPARDLPPPHRRGAGDHYPPLPPPRASSPHGPSPLWTPPPGGGPPGDRDRDRDLMRDMRGRDYRPGPMEYPPPPPHAHGHPHPHPHPHGHDLYRPRSPPHGPPPPGSARPYGRGGYSGRGDRYPPPRP